MLAREREIDEEWEPGRETERQVVREGEKVEQTGIQAD